MEGHIRLIGILWISLGVVTLIGAVIVFAVLMGVSFIPDMESTAQGILRIVAISVSLFLAALSLPKIIAGIYLMKMREWARILTLILSGLSLLNLPLGTALGVYSFVILLKDETVKLFKPAPASS
jgi:hypothetical protein